MDIYNEQLQKRRASQIADAVMLKYRDVLVNREEGWEFLQNYRFAFYIGKSKYQPYDDKTMFEIVFGHCKNHTEEDMEFNTFTPFQSMTFLHMYEGVLPEWLKDYFERFIVWSMDKNIDPHWDFVGVNDNTPAMIMALCILAGEYFGREDWIDVGLYRLAQFEQMIEDRDFISEFTSPTYSAITTLAMAQLYNFSKIESVKARALKCEHALWRQLLKVWHRGTAKLAGPYSRAYHIDSMGHTSQDRMLMYQVMGEDMTVHALNTTFREGGFEGLQLHGANGKVWWFMEFENGNVSSAIYHCPREYIEEAMSVEYPVFVKGKAQISASADNYLIKDYNSGMEGQGRTRRLEELKSQDDLHEYPAGVSEIYSYMSDYYTLGTCTKEFHNGIQTDSLFMLIADSNPISCQEEMTTLYTRYTINDKARSLTLKSDMGRKVAYSYLNDGIVLYTPKTGLQNMNVGSTNKRDEFVEVSSLKCQVLIDDRFHNIKGLEANGKPLSIGDEIDSDTPIYVRFDKVYLAIYPVVKGRKVRIEKEDTMISISLIDYEGDAREFARKELKLVGSGFVVRARSIDEIESYEAFKAMCDTYEVEDVMYANLHTRFAVERKTRFVSEGISLESCYSPISEGIRYTRANGKLLSADK
ncbi:MAG: hypothetical protein J6Q52_05980 [Clostridia bacterium]|nr:hypothetical protein [Clostridia bacterium]